MRCRLRERRNLGFRCTDVATVAFAHVVEIIPGIRSPVLFMFDPIAAIPVTTDTHLMLHLHDVLFCGARERKKKKDRKGKLDLSLVVGMHAADPSIHPITSSSCCSFLYACRPHYHHY